MTGGEGIRWADCGAAVRMEPGGTVNAPLRALRIVERLRPALAASRGLATIWWEEV